MYYTLRAIASNFIIKITGRYFIPYFKDYLLNVNQFEGLCQNNINNCEIVGCNLDNFEKIFNISLLLPSGYLCNHIEELYTYRISKLDKIFILPVLNIEPTQMGGNNIINSSL